MAKRGPKPGLTLERHREIGLELAVMRDRLAELGTEVANAYPASGPKGRLGRGLLKLLAQFDQIRSDGENTMCAEHGRGGIEAYYPTSEARQAFRSGGAPS
jgi:hypothetical protein